MTQTGLRIRLGRMLDAMTATSLVIRVPRRL